MTFFNPITHRSLKMDDKKNDKSLVNLIQHEVNIQLDQRIDELNLKDKVEDIEKKVDGIEQDAIFNDNFSDLFYEEQSNNELLTRDDLRDTVSEELDNILDELKITRQ